MDNFVINEKKLIASRQPISSLTLII